MCVFQPIADFVAKAMPSIASWQPWLAGHTLIRFCDDATLIPLNIPIENSVVLRLLCGRDLAEHHTAPVRLCFEGRELPQDVSWAELPVGRSF